MTQKRCRNCAYWGDRDVGRDMGERQRSCGCPKMLYGYHVGDDEIPDDGSHIEDDEGWGMTTGPDFGCIHFTASTKEEA